MFNENFDKAVERMILISSIARKWYMKFHTTEMTSDEVGEYVYELMLNDITDEETTKINEFMSKYYIEYLEDKVKCLEQKLNGGNK